MRGPQADRKYTDYRQPITDAQIAAHLDGRITLAAPLIGPDGLAQTVALDVDSGGAAALQRLLNAAQALGWMAYAMTSTTKEHNGGHLWLHLDAPATPDRARLLAQQIAEAAQVEAETYPTRKQLRLPLGIHRWTGKRGTLLLQDGTTLDLDSGDAAIHQALELIASLPTNHAEHLPEVQTQPTPTRTLHTPRRTCQEAPGSTIQAYNKQTDLISLLESYGARIAEQFSSGGALLHCPCGHHNHGDRRPSLHVKPATSSRYGRFVVFGYSPTCQFYTERGQTFAAFDVVCKLEGLTAVEALKRINPCRPPKPSRRRPAPEPEPEPDWREPTPEERAETAEQRRKRIAEAHALHAEIRERMDADRQLSKRARAVLDVLLSWDLNRSWCRMSTARIAKDHLHVSERTVQRGMRELERRRYIESDEHTTHDGRIYQGGWSTTIRRFLRVTTQAATCHPCIKLESDLNPKSVKACEPPRDSAQPLSSSVAEPIAWEGGASYTPAEDWTLQTRTVPERRAWQASIPPKDFFTLYRAPREHTTAFEPVPVVVDQRPVVEQPAQAEIQLVEADAPTAPSEAAQAQLAHLATQIWRQPPTDARKRRTYYALQRKAVQVERSNPRQAHALRMQARALEEVSELLITATSCTPGEQRQADMHQADDSMRRQMEPALVTGRASSEPPGARSPLPGIQIRPRLVNITTTPPSSTSGHAGAAPHVLGGGSHAQKDIGRREIDEIWISAKRRQIAHLEEQGQHERAAVVRQMFSHM